MTWKGLRFSVKRCCACCHDIFTRNPGVAMPFALTGVALAYVSWTGNNHYKTKILHNGLTISALDQINKVYVTTKPISGFSARLILCDIEAGIAGYNKESPTLSVNPFTVIYEKANTATVYTINSVALDKRGGTVYFVERANTAGVSTFTLYSMSYQGGAVNTVHTFPSTTIATGYSIWHPGLLALYIVTQTTTLNELKMITVGGETTLHTAPKSGTGPSSGFIHCLELDLERAELWWVEREVGVNRKDIVKRSDFFASAPQTMFTTAETHVINSIKRSYKQNRMIFNYFRRDIPKAEDTGSGLFHADYDLPQFNLFYDHSVEFNEDFGQIQLGNVMEPSFELYCGLETTGPDYEGA